MDILNNINIINYLLVSIGELLIFISLFKLYYESKSHSKNNIIKNHQ